MADIIDSSWNPNDESNTGVAPDGVQGGYAPSTVAPILRTIRGATKRFYEQINPIYTSTGSANAYVLTYPIAPDKLTKGIQYAFWANHTNTGPATLNINGLGARAIVSSDKNPLVASQILIDTIITVAYDGIAFRMIATSTVNPKFTGTATFENITSTGITNLSTLNVSGTTTAQSIVATNINLTGASVYISGAGNRHIWFRDSSDKTTGLIFNNSTSNMLTFRSYDLGETTYKEMHLRADGQLLLPTVPTLDNAAVTKAYVENKTIVAGNGLTGGGSFVGNVTVTLGSPTTVTNTTINSVTATGHTHALTLVSGDITGALGYTPLTPAQVSSAITSATNGTMGGRAYPRRVGGAEINFNWSGQGGQPTWLWGGSDGTNMYVYNPSNFNVNYANNAGSVNGWTIDSIRGEINWRVSDTRFAGFISNEVFTTGGRTSPATGGSGYVTTSISKRNVELFDVQSRQPQIHIPNSGWRALGGW